MQLLYLHGFNSSPDSHKARLIAKWLEAEHPEVQFLCPQMSPYPHRALEDIMVACGAIEWPSTLVMGSSMGGFYATWLVERFACKGVLINPAVRPWLGREYLLGQQTNYHSGETYLIERHHLEDFADYAVERLSHPENLWVLLQTGDEVLDYRQAVDLYRGCRQTVEEGGDHGFQGFERFLPDIISFWNQ